MTLHWNHVRISASEHVGARGISRPEPPAALHGLVSDLRAADPAGRWFFHWSDEPFPSALDVWAGGTAGVLEEFAPRFEELGAALGKTPGHPPAHGEFPAPAGMSRELLGIECADEVSTASSELALAVCAEPVADQRAQLALAVWQLRHVVALLDESARRGFLFRVWQHRTAALSPAQRTALCTRGAETCTVLADGLPAMSPAVQRGWDGYLRTLRRTALAWRAGDAAVNYLLFEHTHLTLRRLRVPPAVEALAARTLRAALTPSGADRHPLAVPGAVLQTA